MENIEINRAELGICQPLNLDQERVHYERVYRACRGVELRARASELERASALQYERAETAAEFDHAFALDDLAADMRRAAMFRDGIWRD